MIAVQSTICFTLLLLYFYLTPTDILFYHHFIKMSETDVSQEDNVRAILF